MEPEQKLDLAGLHKLQNQQLINTFAKFSYMMKQIIKLFSPQLQKIKGWNDFVALTKEDYWKGYGTFSTYKEVVHPDTSNFLHGCMGMLSHIPIRISSDEPDIMGFVQKSCPTWPWLIAAIDKRLAQENQLLNCIVHPIVDKTTPEPEHKRIGRDLLEMQDMLSKLRTLEIQHEKLRTHVSSPAQNSKIRK
jgi:hypothetical protein